MSQNSVVVMFRARFSAAAEQPLRANAPMAVALGGVACLLGFVLVGPLVSRGAADDTGILSFLLGESRNAPAARQPTYFAQSRSEASSWFGRKSTSAARVARANVRHAPPRMKTAEQKHRLRPIVVVTPPTRPATFAKNSPTLLTDDTLRRGDAVMTAKGVRIFNGARHYPFQVADFRSLAFAGRVPHRSALLAIDRVVRPSAWSASFTQTSPLAAMSPRPTDDPVAIRLIDPDRRS